MSLEWERVQAPFKYGVDEGDDPHAVPLGVLTTLDNYVWKRGSRIDKRQGADPMSSNAYVDGGATTALPAMGQRARLLTRNDELLVTNGALLFSYTPATLSWRTLTIPNVTNTPVGVAEVIPTWSTVVDQMSGVTSCDIVQVGNVVWIAWTGGTPGDSLQNRFWVQAIDATTGAVVLAPQALVTSVTTNGARIVATGSYVVAVTRTGAASPFTIKGWVFDPQGAFLGSSITLVSDNAANNSVACWDIDVNAPDSIVLGYNRTGAIVALEQFAVGSGTFTNGAHGTVTDANGCMTISLSATFGESLYVAYINGGAGLATTRAAVNNPATLAAVTAAVTLDTPAAGGRTTYIGVCRYSATQGLFASTVVEFDNTMRTSTFLCLATTLAVSRTVGPYWSTMLQSKPFMLGGASYLGAAFTIATNTGIIGTTILSGDIARYVAPVELVVGGYQTQRATLPAPRPSGNSSLLPLLFQATALADGFSLGLRQGVKMVRLTSGNDRPLDAYRGLQYGAEGFISGGIFLGYDGASAFDYGFATIPIHSTSFSAVGGAIQAGAYIYSFILEYRSKTGLLYRSRPSVPTTVTTTGTTGTVTVGIVNENVLNKRDPSSDVLVAGYRTVAGGTIPQRLTYEPTYNARYFVQGVGSQAFIDTRDDASVIGAPPSIPLAGRPARYVENELEDYPPPGNISGFMHVNRIFLLDGSRRTWWFSKSFQDNIGTAPGFHPDFRIVFGGDQTAGASMDDHAVFFAPDGIRYMQGYGPAKDGTNNDFATPIKVQTDVGCSNPRSIVSVPDGLMFQSAKGIMLLSRGFDVTWIGKPIQNTLALYPNITSAVLVPKRDEVRFTALDATGTAGVTFVYNYVEKQWSTMRHFMNASGLGAPIFDAILWQGAWVMLLAAGPALELEASNLDSGAYVKGTIETAWITKDGPMYFQSVREFSMRGRANTNHDLLIEAAYDSSTLYQQSRTWYADSGVTAIGDLEDFRFSPNARRKCHAIRFRITDSVPTTPGLALGTGAGPSWETLGLQVGSKKGDDDGARRKG